MKIVWTKRATQHLRAAYDYWAREQSEDAADLMLQRILASVDLLEYNPEIGRSGRIPSTRELVLKPLPFLLAYRVRSNEFELVALLHGARKWPGQFK
jgi:toxin ParE1/3/4